MTGWLEFGVGVIDAWEAWRSGADAPALDELRAGFHAGEGTADPFWVIAGNAGVSGDDAEVLAVLAVAEFEPSQHHRIAVLQGDAAKNRITTGTLLHLFGGLSGGLFGGEAFAGADGRHRSVLAVAPDAALRRAALVDVIADGPWSDHVVALHPSVSWALAGDPSADPALPQPHSIEVAAAAGGAPFVVVTGPDRRRRLAAAVDRTAGARFLVVDAPATDAEWAAVVREATLTGMSVVVEVDERLAPAGARWIERAGHVAWAVSSRLELSLDELPDRPWVACTGDEAPPTDDEWAATFGADTGRTHPLRAEQLPRVGRAFEAHGRDLDAAVRRLVSGRLDHLARRIRPTRVWDDLVLSAERKAALHSIVDRYRFADRVFDDWGFAAGASSRGTVALFSGPSGTGKTLAAEVIAGQLGLDVFKLDLSAVVSKYIGETEKNLEQVFDAASAGNLVLFFDEADALFGKRSEVSDARDRYANIEVSYLLQRLEAYEGLVVMATNFEKNVDEAFLRRIHTRIEFALPGPEERATIWRNNLPATAPLGEIDVEWIADRFEVSGGLIRNAVVHAAFLAAAEDAPISTGHAVRGVALELRKLGRLIKPDGFGPYYDLVTRPFDEG